MEYILEMKGITKRFSGVTALSNVDLKLAKGEVHTLLGENGAGKSTLMKILSGVYTPDEGQIILKGKKTDIKNPKESQNLVNSSAVSSSLKDEWFLAQSSLFRLMFSLLI